MNHNIRRTLSAILERANVTRMPSSLTVAAIILAWAVGSPLAQASVIYQDNFQSATNGQSIFASPVNWVSAGVQGGGNFTIDNSTPFGPALAVDRPNPADFGVARFPISSPSTAPGSGDIVITAQVYVPNAAPIDAWVGLNKSSLGPFNNTGVYAGCGNTGSNVDLAFDLRGIGGAEHDFTPAESAPLIGEIITAKIVMNVDTNTVTGTFTDGVNTLTYTLTGGLNFSGFDNVAINETANHTPVMYVGSLQVTQGVPEPSSVCLLVVGSVVGGLLYRRLGREGGAC